MLHISLKELMSCVKEDLISNHLRLNRQESQGILELIPESESTPALVEGGASPDTARYRLVHQPAIHHKVERIVRCPYLQR